MLYMAASVPNLQVQVFLGYCPNRTLSMKLMNAISNVRDNVQWRRSVEEIIVGLFFTLGRSPRLSILGGVDWG